MRDRLKSLKRVLAVQKQMVELAEWRLAASQRQSDELKADQVLLQEFVSGESLSPLLATAAFKRGRSLQAAVAQAEVLLAARIQHGDAMRRREALAGKLVDKAHIEAEQEAEKRDLQEIMEAWSWGKDASFP